MKIGDRIQVCACKADGSVYRRWHTAIETIDADSIVTVSPLGSETYDHKRENIPIGRTMRIEDGSLRFKDYELDMRRYLSSAAQLPGEDEFVEAVITYQYTKEFQEQMYSVANEALEVASGWNANPAPDFRGEDAK